MTKLVLTLLARTRFLGATLLLATGLCVASGASAATDFSSPCCDVPDDWQAPGDIAMNIALAGGSPGAGTPGSILVRLHDASSGQGPARDVRLEVWVQDQNTDGLGWAGRLSVGPTYRFACNGSQTLLTGDSPGCWQASTATWAGTAGVPEGRLVGGNPLGLPVLPLEPAAGTPVQLGSVDGGPWRLAADHPLAGSGAGWIWAAPDPQATGGDMRPGLPYAVFSTQLVAAPVHEPATAILAVLGLLGLGAAGRRGRPRAVTTAQAPDVRA